MNKQVSCVILRWTFFLSFWRWYELPNALWFIFGILHQQKAIHILEAWKMLTYIFMSLTICLHLPVLWETLVFQSFLFLILERITNLITFLSIWFIVDYRCYSSFKVQMFNRGTSYNDTFIGGIGRMIRTLLSVSLWQLCAPFLFWKRTTASRP